MNKRFVWLLCAALVNPVAMADNFAAQLKGKRLVLQGAHCAGWTFGPSGQYADWRNEADCAASDEYKTRWRVQWLDEDHLLLTETERSNDNLPPRNFVYQVLSIRQHTVTLKHYWTGWGQHPAEIEKFTLR